MSLGLGKDAKLYFDASGVDGSTWTLLENAKDVTLNASADESDVTTRAAGGWKATVTTLKDASVDFEMLWDPAADGFTEIRDAYLNGTLIGLAIMDALIATVGTQGLQADFTITAFNKNEPIGEAQSVSVTAKPTYSTTAPAWVTISS